jgi:hypothetical protein
MRAFGADDVNPTRTPSAWMKLPVPMRTNEHAFGVDDELLYRIPVPSPVLGVGHISRALLGHSCQAPKTMVTNL